MQMLPHKLVYHVVWGVINVFVQIFVLYVLQDIIYINLHIHVNHLVQMDIQHLMVFVNKHMDVIQLNIGMEV